MSRRSARASAAVANSSRADRAAGVPPRPAPAPDPDGGARAQRHPARWCRARRRRPAARHDRSTSRRPAAATSCCASTSPARWRPTTRRSCRPSRRSSRASRASASVSSSSTRSAATVFPLTDDYDFINGELDSAWRALTGDPEYDSFFAGTFNGRGTSLIGDGLATCVSSFDKVDLQRARSVVFATDNHLAGRPIIDVDEAGELAKAKGVRVYGLNPEESGPDDEAVQMRHVVTGTGGRYYAMGDQTAIKGIVDAVQAQEATLIDAASRSLYSDNPTVPIAAGRHRAHRRHRREPEVGVVSFLPVAPWPVLLVVVVGALAAVWWNPSSRTVPGESRGDPLAPHGGRGAPRCRRLRPAVPGEQVDTTAANLNVYFVVDTTSSIIAEDYGDGRPRIEGVAARHLARSPRPCPGARYSVVTFDQAARVRLPLTTDTTALDAAVETLLPESYEVSQRHVRQRGQRPPQDAAPAGRRAHPRARPHRLLPRRRRADRAGPPTPFDIDQRLINGGAVLGYGTTEGGRMKATRSRFDTTLDLHQGPADR